MKSAPLAAAVALLTAVPALGQYSADPLNNLLVADQAYEEAQPKLVPTADGGCYVSWFANDPGGSPAGGYDVRLQRLDAAGRPEWAAGGILIADRGFSSTQDYGLAVDSTGHALLAFRDDRVGGTQITAQRVTPAGLPLWGPLGVQLTATTDFLAAPKVCGTTDGSVVVAWTQNNTVHLQRLDANGVATWPSDAVLPAGSGANSLSDLNASDSGSAIFSYVVDGGTFGSPRHLYAQKIAPTQTPLWNPAGVALLDSGSLQFGNFPTFEPDGAGGGLFTWYTSSPQLESFAQRLDAAGNELFPHNGSRVATTFGQIWVGPTLAFDPAEQELFVVCEELDASQTFSNVLVQKFDAAGNRQWGDAGKVVQAVQGNISLGIADLNPGGVDGVLVVFADSTAGFGQTTLHQARLDDAGTPTGPIGGVSTAAATKYRLTVASTALGHVLCTWQDEGSGSADVAVQDVLPDGSLGGVAGTTQLLGSGANPVALVAATDPRIGQVFSVAVDKSPAPGATLTALFIYGAASPPVPLPQGELLVDVTSPLVGFSLVAGPTSADAHLLPVPLAIDLVGIGLAAQAAIVGGGGGDVLTNGLALTLGL